MAIFAYYHTFLIKEHCIVKRPFTDIYVMKMLILFMLLISTVITVHKIDQYFGLFGLLDDPSLDNKKVAVSMRYIQTVQ